VTAEPNARGPLAGITSIRVKLGLLVVASTVAVLVVAAIGRRAGVPTLVSGPVTIAARSPARSTSLATSAPNRCASPNSCSSNARKFSRVNCRKKPSSPRARVSRLNPNCSGPCSSAIWRNSLSGCSQPAATSLNTRTISSVERRSR